MVLVTFCFTFRQFSPQQLIISNPQSHLFHGGVENLGRRVVLAEGDREHAGHLDAGVRGESAEVSDHRAAELVRRLGVGPRRERQGAGAECTLEIEHGVVHPGHRARVFVLKKEMQKEVMTKE